MTTAQNGLAKALARGSSGEVIALAELPVADLLASLSDEQKAEISASLSPPAPKSAAAHPEPDDNEPDGDPDDSMCPKCKEPMKDGKCSKCSNAAEASDNRVKVVAAAVATDDACKGKAGLALQMLADDDFAELSGNALVKLIGKTATEGAEASGADPEAAARDEMKAALAAQGNSSVDANGGGAPKAGSEANTSAMWDHAIKLNNPGVKLD